MNQHPFVIRQVFQLIPKYTFEKFVKHYKGDYRYRHFNSYNHLFHLLFGQVTGCDSIRDICLCLEVHENALYHLGILKTVDHSTLSRAGEKRDYRIFEGLGFEMIRIVSPLYKNEEVPDLESFKAGEMYAIDSTTISCSIKLMTWALGKYSKGAIKMHTILNLKGSIPDMVVITDGKYHDSNFLDEFEPHPNAFYVMDKAYVDFKALWEFNTAGSYWVTRPKDNIQYEEVERNYNIDDINTGLRYDAIIRLTGYKSSQLYPEVIRLVRYYDSENDRMISFITNCMDISALEVTQLYRNRWQIEVFFKWIKQNLTIKYLWGCSENTVKIHLWCAVIAYLLIAYAKAIYKSSYTVTECATIIRVSAFERTDIATLLTKRQPETLLQNQNVNELTLF